MPIGSLYTNFLLGTFFYFFFSFPGKLHLSGYNYFEFLYKFLNSSRYESYVGSKFSKQALARPNIK